MHCMHAVHTALCMENSQRMHRVVCMDCTCCMYCTQCMRPQKRCSQHQLVSNESKNPPRRSDIEAKVRPTESRLTVVIARPRHVAGTESNQEADSSQRDCRGDRTETPGMPTGSRPKSGGFDNSGLDSTDCSAVAERPYPASSYPGHHFEASGNGLPLQKISDTAPRKQVDRCTCC